MGKTITVDYVKGQNIDIYKDKEALDKMSEEQLHVSLDKSCPCPLGLYR